MAEAPVLDGSKLLMDDRLHGDRDYQSKQKRQTKGWQVVSIPDNVRACDAVADTQAKAIFFDGADAEGAALAPPRPASTVSASASASKSRWHDRVKMHDHTIHLHSGERTLYTVRTKT